MPRRRPLLTRGEEAATWIEDWCVLPGGKPLQLSPAERAKVYGAFDAGVLELIDGPLAAYLTLASLAGPSDLHLPPHADLLRTDLFSVWNAAGRDLRRYLQRKGAQILCPERGTRWTAAA